MLKSLTFYLQETEVSTFDMPNSLYPDLLATESTLKEKGQPLTTIEEYANNFISLIKNIIPIQQF